MSCNVAVLVAKQIWHRDVYWGWPTKGQHQTADRVWYLRLSCFTVVDLFLVWRQCSSASGWKTCRAPWSLERCHRLTWTWSGAWYRPVLASSLILRVNVPCPSCSSCWRQATRANRRRSNAWKLGLIRTFSLPAAWLRITDFKIFANCS